MTREQLRDCLARLEMHGKNLVVHADLERLGLREEQAEWVVETVLEAAGPAGTVLMPTFTVEKTLLDVGSTGPAVRSRPAVVPFHPDLATSEPVAEAFRRLPGVLRSHHPTHSFAAQGPLARELLSTHRDNNPLGPLKKLNVFRGSVLLLGCSLQRVVGLHLALEMAGLSIREKMVALRINAAGYRERVVIDHFPGCTRAFDKLEPLLDGEAVREIALPAGSIRIVPFRYLLQLATRVLRNDPLALFCEQRDCAGCRAKRSVLGRANPEARSH